MPTTPNQTQGQPFRHENRESWATALENARLKRSALKRKRLGKVGSVRKESDRLKQRLRKQRDATSSPSNGAKPRNLGTGAFRRTEHLFRELVAKYAAKTESVVALAELLASIVQCLTVFPGAVSVREGVLRAKDLRSTFQEIALKFADLCQVRRGLRDAQRDQVGVFSL